MDKPALELAKLQAELDKLQAEKDEIQLRIDDRPSTRRLDKWKVYPAYIGVVTTLLVIGLQWEQHQNQIKEQHRFVVDQQLTTLVGQLVDSSNPSLQRTAAMQLALFGKPAVPVLLESLDFEITSPVVEAISRALIEIAHKEDNPSWLSKRFIEKENNANWLLTQTIESTSAFMNRQLESDIPNPPTIKRHLIALVTVANHLPSDLKTAESTKLKLEAIQELNDLNIKIVDRFKDSTDESVLQDVSELQDVIERGIQQLRS